MDFTKDIYINKDTIYEDQDIVLLYKGNLFSNSLTNDVYISYGYGNMWENKQEVKMKPSTFGYLVTVKVESGESLQFCFRDSNGNWDNNNNQNYILPIHETEEILSFKTLADTSQKVSFEPFEQPINKKEQQDDNNEIFNPSVVSSNQVELYKTVDLENITEQTIPDDTIITQITLDTENQNILKEAIIKSEEPRESVAVAFSKLTEKAKQQSMQAFDDDKVTAGSMYVNSIVKDIPEVPKIVENIDEKSLTVKEPSSLEKVGSFFKTLFTNVKSAGAKLVKLIKTSLQFNDDEE